MIARARERVRPPQKAEQLAARAGTDFTGRLAAPMLWPDVLAQLPPSRLVTGSRAFEMSPIINAHSKLTLAGARSQVHVWDGLGQCLYLDPDLPESREVEKIIVDFFAQTLGGAGT